MQFTAPLRDEHIINRQIGTVQRIDSEGNIHLRMDSVRDVQLSVLEIPRISVTAMPSPATAAREPPPTGCLFTWTPTTLTNG
jgi:hypothetical protein